MLKRHWRIISKLERILDNTIIVGMFFLAYGLRDTLIPLYVSLLDLLSHSVGDPLTHQVPKLAPLAEYLIVLGVALPLYNASLSMNGAYRSMRLFSYWKIFYTAALSSLMSFLGIGSILYLLKLDLSRSFVGIFCLLSTAGIFYLRLLVLAALRFFRERGKNYRNVMIFGSGEQAEAIEAELVSQAELGIRVVSRLAPFSEKQLAGAGRESNGKSKKKAPSAADIPDSEEDKRFESELRKHAIDEVVFTEVIPHFEVVKRLAVIASDQGVKVTLAADFFSLSIAKSDVSYLGNVPLLHYHAAPNFEYRPSLLLKRVLDLIVSATLLLLLWPFAFLVALAIKLESSGPVFFKQKRVGLNGRVFTMLKFRSMSQNAESLQQKLRKENEMSGPVFKLKKDPRITRVGKFLRRYSIDESPQLLNVLLGDMSLVGPRPPIPSEVRQYRRKQRKRLSMRPGLTCTWQVSGRNEIPDFETWAELDLEYIENWSLWNDFKLLLRTVPAVLSGDGAS